MYPSKESVLRAVGQPQDLTAAAVFLLKNRRVEVKVVVADVPKKKYAKQVIGLKDVARIRASGAGGLVEWERLFETDRDWWVNVLQMEPFEGGETFP